MKKGILIITGIMIIITIGCYGIEMYSASKKEIKETIELTEEDSNLESELDCKFDLETQTDAFLKSIPEFSNYTWDNEQKKAIIKLKDKSTLIVTRGGCNHFSFYGNLLLSNSKLNINQENEIFKKALWIAEKLFVKPDFEQIKQMLKNKEYKINRSENRYHLVFNQEDYCDMTLVVESFTEQNLMSIQIGFYQC